MMASANIFAQYAQPMRSVADYSNEYARGDYVQGQNALQRLQYQQASTAAEQANASRNALQQIASGWGANTTTDQRVMALRNSGRPELMQQADTLEKQALDKRKIDSEATGKDVETENKVIGFYRDVIGMANDPQTAAMYVQAMHADPRLKSTAIAKVPLDQALGQIGGDPQSFEAWKQKFALGAAKFVEMNKPTLTTQNLGGTSRIVATPGLGGASTVATEAPITQSADNIATNATSRANNAATVGASYAHAAAVKSTGDAVREAAVIKDKRDTEMKLADDYRQQSKLFGETKSAYEQINSALPSATKSPVATLAAATKFMKIIDPGSVVRESELGMALAASGVIDRAMNYVNVLQRGKVLTETQAKDFKNISDKIYEAAKQVQRDIDKSYGDKAKTYGLRPEMVTQDLGQNAKVIDFASLPN